MHKILNRLNAEDHQTLNREDIYLKPAFNRACWACLPSPLAANWQF